MKLKYLPILALLLVTATPRLAAELIDGDGESERFCYPEAHKNTRKSCECNDSATPWGIRAISVDCSYKDLRNDDISEALPLYVDTVDLSWNALQLMPDFISDRVRLLNLMHNNVSRIGSGNFKRVPKLHELYLSWNSIQAIEINAFDGLAHLQVLDLAHNNLHALSSLIFAPLLILDTLSLSWNRQLNHTAGIQQLDFYATFGVNLKLSTLKLKACNLANLTLPATASLLKLDMRGNLLKRVPQQLPTSLEKFDLSENPIEALLPADTAQLPRVQELFLEDMPALRSVEAETLVPLQSLNKISFQNSRRLTSFHAHAFGANATNWPPLRSMIFRGTSLRSFNSTLSPVFHQLTTLDLNGMPLECDCQLIWVRALTVETNGRCLKPSRLHGMRLSSARVSDFSCDSWPRWVSGLFLLGLLILCSVGIYLIVMGLRPHRGVTMRRKVGAGSPYARVTFEPKRDEQRHF